ncbi:MAG: hypothetical protein IT370_22335 [Deltaproteobacteria bacterium]|nr:hypothetical protein [Deltaproteobacteria bacterium]
MTPTSLVRAGALLGVLTMAGCGSPRGTGAAGPTPSPRPGAADAAVPAVAVAVGADAGPGTAPGTLQLDYQGAAFMGPSMLFVTLHRADGTSYPLKLRSEMYSALQDCSKCPADGPITEHSPMPGGPPPMEYRPGPLARYLGASFTMDVVAECPAGGRCIRPAPIPAGDYSLTLGHKLSCPGTVTVPLVGDTVLTCTR